MGASNKACPNCGRKMKQQFRVLYRAPEKNLEASMASRFFYCPETLFSLIFSLIVPQASETLLINCSIRAALSCFICFVTCP